MKPLYGLEIEKKIVLEEKKKGTKIGEAVLCSDFLYHSYFFKTRYIRYCDIDRAYLRIESGESGDFSVDEISLAIIDKAGVEHKLHLDYKQYVQEILEYFKNNYPDIVISKNK